MASRACLAGRAIEHHFLDLHPGASGTLAKSPRVCFSPATHTLCNAVGLNLAQIQDSDVGLICLQLRWTSNQTGEFGSMQNNISV